MAYARSFKKSDFAPPGFGAPEYAPIGEISEDLDGLRVLKARERDIRQLARRAHRNSLFS